DSPRSHLHLHGADAIALTRELDVGQQDGAVVFLPGRRPSDRLHSAALASDQAADEQHRADDTPTEHGRQSTSCARDTIAPPTQRLQATRRWYAVRVPA